ncbi:hypothetical protein MKZ38_007373 [Zalerion maritima]|uniref:Uncharacterized protein n=1 Tax=Zalerion maritima TaxID=339359 RepID=A0AAD5WP80_9PEZI|nr:hypothetical protein MKZ38_007373 [Zalerion maritima]
MKINILLNPVLPLFREVALAARKWHNPGRQEGCDYAFRYYVWDPLEMDTAGIMGVFSELECDTLLFYDSCQSLPSPFKSNNNAVTGIIAATGFEATWVGIAPLKGHPNTRFSFEIKISGQYHFYADLIKCETSDGLRRSSVKEDGHTGGLDKIDFSLPEVPSTLGLIEQDVPATHRKRPKDLQNHPRPGPSTHSLSLFASSSKSDRSSPESAARVDTQSQGDSPPQDTPLAQLNLKGKYVDHCYCCHCDSVR